MTKRKINLRSLPALFLSTTLLLLPTGCGDDHLPGNTDEVAPIRAPIATAKLTPEDIVHEAVGTVRSRTASTISSKLMGTVRSILVKEGDRFQKGDLLLVMDPRQVSAQLRQANATLAEARQAQTAAVSARNAAQAGSKLAEATYERYRQLMKEESASRQEFDEIEAKHLQAKAALVQAEAMVSAAAFRVQRAEAGVSAVKVSKQDAAIRAPYDGWVTGKLINEGSLASPGTPLLTIEGMAGYRIDTVVPEKYIQVISLNQEVRVHTESLKGKSLVGTVEAIAPAADNRSHTFLVKVSIPDDPAILSGVFARVSIPLRQIGKITIPTEAVVRQGQLTGLFIVDERQIARFRLIRTGRTFGENVEVLSGLREGDRYVAAPPARLVDGARVQPGEN